MTLAAILAGAQGIYGLSQLLGGATMNTPDRPTYQPNQATQEMVNATRTEANSAIVPGQMQMQDALRANTANAVNTVQRNSTNPASILAAAGAAQMGENRSLSQLYQQNLSYKDRARARQMQALSSLSQAQDKQWEINKQQPWMDAVNTKSALFGGGMTTLGDSLGGLGAILQNKQLQKPEDTKTPLGSIYNMNMPTGNGSLYSNIV